MANASGAGEATGLRPVLGRWTLLSIGVGAIVGAGIFVIPGPAAAQFAGPAIVLSFVIAALGCALAGLCYAELAAMFPVAGSAYAYSLRAFGRVTAWVVGWLLILEYIFAAAIVTQGFSAYAGVLLPNVSPTFHQALVKGVLPVLLVISVSFLAIRGIELSARVNNVIVVMKVMLIMAVICFGIPYINPRHWTPFVPANTGHWGEFGWSGVIRAAGIVFYTFLGFDIVSVSAQEARRPQRDIPFALLGSLVACCALFIPLTLVVLGLTDYRLLNVADPIALALKGANGHLDWLVPLVGIGATIGMISVVLVVLMGQARILFAMANDGLLPAVLGRLHSHWETPYMATLAGAAVVLLLALSVPISLLAQMVSVGVLSAFVAVALAVLVLRRRQPNAVRPFRTPWVPFVPVGAMLVCGYMAVGLPALTWLRFVCWLAIGAVVYGLYGRRNQAPAAGSTSDEGLSY